MSENIDHIAETVLSRTEEEYFSKLVPNDEVLDNEANPSIGAYVEKPDTREKIDIAELNARIKEIVAREQGLREQIDAIVAELEA